MNVMNFLGTYFLKRTVRMTSIINSRLTEAVILGCPPLKMINRGGRLPRSRLTIYRSG